MKWSDEYAIGIDRIDVQHKRLFEISEEFRAALDSDGSEKVYDLLLNILEIYSRNHFKFEEGCMQKHRCPVALRNKNGHETFLAAFSHYRSDYAANGFRLDAAINLTDMLDSWLQSHICNIDIHLRKCVAKH